MSDQPITHKEAREMLSRFNASHWSNPGEHARYSIPARPDRDDDIRLARYIGEQEQRGAALKACVAFAVDYLSDQNHEVAERDSWIAMCEALEAAGINVFEIAERSDDIPDTLRAGEVSP